MELQLYKNLYSMDDGDFWTGGFRECLREVDLKLGREIACSFSAATFIGCGTSCFAGIYGKYLFEKLLGLNCSVLEGNAGRYIDEKLYNSATLYIGISNSGNSGTVVESMRAARDHGCKTLCITGDESSLIAKTSDVVLLFAGKKDNVPTKTRSYVETLMMLAALGVKLSELRGAKGGFTREYLEGQAPGLAQAAHSIFEAYSDRLETLAGKWKDKSSYNVVAAGIHQATANEGSLKICEIGWVNSQAMELENYLHGKLRGASPDSPYFIIGTRDISYPLVLSFTALAKKTGADAVVISDRPAKPVVELAELCVEIRDGLDELLKPLVFILPIYIFGMHLGIARGHEDPSASQFGAPAQTLSLSDLYPEYGDEAV
jgi:glucosamine--fructose-6-phosphate aminotransferase (isomerizing)